MIQTDFLIIGSGIAGLSYALKVSDHCKDSSITIVTKSKKEESNTKYAQGGIAVVSDTECDSFEKHIEDTLIAGDSLCDEKVVKTVIEKAPERLKELTSWGVQFDKTSKGDYNLNREGGHSQHRILHHKDTTGNEILKALFHQVKKKPNITLLENHFSVDLITNHQLLKTKNSDKTISHKDRIICYGAYVFNEKTKEMKTINSKITMLASGGIGQVYKTTTNPEIATGDGIAMAYRAKAKVEDIEFIQFHPTALYEYPSISPAFLITEAIRGEEAILKNIHGERFMKKYDPRLELAPRDIVARSIDTELKITGADYVYLDCRNMDSKKISNHFPTIKEKCHSIGIDLKKDLIPVTPAAHYICGGISVNLNGESSIENLYACGECSRTGLHGANRLASNSLLETLVYSHESCKASCEKIQNIPFKNDIPYWDDTNSFQNKENILITHNKDDIQKIMSNYVGIIRSNQRLQRAENRMKILYEENKELYRVTKISIPICELRNMITVAFLIIKASINRKKNKGGFYNIDCV